MRRTLARIRRIGPLAVAGAISTVNSLIIAIVYARVAGTESYGAYQLAIAVTALAAILALGGSPMASMRAAAQGRPIAWALFWRRLPWCGAAAVVLAGVGAVMLAAGDPRIGEALLASALVLPLAVGGDVAPAELLGAGRFTALVRYQAGLQTTSAVLVTTAVITNPGAPWLAVLALQLSLAAWQFAYLLRARTATQPTADDLRYLRGLSALNVLTNVDARLDVTLAGFLLGTREAGIVAIARTIPLQMKHVWELLYQPVFNRLAASTPVDALAWIRAERWKLVAGLGGLVLVVAALCPIAIPLLFGDDFDDAILPAQLVLVAFAILTLGLLQSTFLRARGEMRELSTLLVALPVTSLVVLPPALLLTGPTGIGIKALAVSLVHVVLAIFLSRRIVAASPSLARARPDAA